VSNFHTLSVPILPPRRRPGRPSHPLILETDRTRGFTRAG